LALGRGPFCSLVAGVEAERLQTQSVCSRSDDDSAKGKSSKLIDLPRSIHSNDLYNALGLFFFYIFYLENCLMRLALLKRSATERSRDYIWPWGTSGSQHTYVFSKIQHKKLVIQ
jgi:hypothetical protein